MRMSVLIARVADNALVRVRNSLDCVVTAICYKLDVSIGETSDTLERLVYHLTGS